MAKSSAININSASSVIVTDEDGVLVATSPMTDGQVLIGSTGAVPVAASLTAGAGISITPGPGALTIAAPGGGSLVNVQYLKSGSGVYTPTAGTVSCYVVAAGGGGPGYFCPGGSLVNNSMQFGTGGGSGAWGMKYYATAPEGSSYSVGSGGTYTSVGVYTAATATTFNNGDMNLQGGSEPEATATITASTTSAVGNPIFFGAQIAKPADTDNSNIKGNGCAAPVVYTRTNPMTSASFGFVDNAGAGSYFGSGGVPPERNTSFSARSVNGNAGLSPGSGGSGALIYNRSGAVQSIGAASGGSGANGIIIIYEYS